jgi:hypothetical protein
MNMSDTGLGIHAGCLSSYTTDFLLHVADDEPVSRVYLLVCD